MKNELLKFKKKNFSIFKFSEKISDIFNQIVKNKSNTAFIVNNRKQLKGVLTFGDFRKAMITNVDFNSGVKFLMNTNFKFCTTNDKNDIIENIFKLNPLLLDLPILDKNKKIKYVFSRTAIDNQKNNLKNYSLVIMAGGYGKRMRPFTYLIPKPLLPVNNKTIIQEIIDRFIKFKIKNVYVISNYKKNILRSFLKIRYNIINFFEEPKFLGTFGGVKFLENKLSNNFILSNCDTLIDFNYLEAINYHNKNQNDITIITAYKSEKSKYGVCNFDKKNNLISLLEKPYSYSYINTGMYIINKKVLKKLKKNQKVDITDFISKNLNNFKFSVFQIHDKQFKDFGTLKDYFSIS
jgi:dTDP-glucose pyrophosphorylase